jgi:hypothetical protein
MAKGRKADSLRKTGRGDPHSFERSARDMAPIVALFLEPPESYLLIRRFARLTA